MTDRRKRALQMAWRSLAGWHVGMADDVLVPFLDAPGTIVGDAMSGLPDVKAYANWGVWSAMALECGLTVEVSPAPWDKDAGAGGWLVSVDGFSHCADTLAGALLGALCEGWSELFMHDAPPEVLTWWKLEQEKSEVDPQ